MELLHQDWEWTIKSFISSETNAIHVVDQMGNSHTMSKNENVTPVKCLLGNMPDALPLLLHIIFMTVLRNRYQGETDVEKW